MKSAASVKNEEERDEWRTREMRWLNKVRLRSSLGSVWFTDWSGKLLVLWYFCKQGLNGSWQIQYCLKQTESLLVLLKFKICFFFCEIWIFKKKQYQTKKFDFLHSLHSLHVWFSGKLGSCLKALKHHGWGEVSYLCSPCPPPRPPQTRLFFFKELECWSQNSGFWALSH